MKYKENIVETYKILDREYPVVGYVSTPQTGTLPLLNIRMMSDERERELGAQSAAKWKEARDA